MLRGMAGRKIPGAFLFFSAALFVSGGGAAPDDLVTDVIEGDQLVLESTTTPSLFMSLAPDDVIEWDVSISTTEPAENIDAELFVEGDIPVAAEVYGCVQPWGWPPNAGAVAAACAEATELQAVHEVPSDGSEGAFDVGENQHLRIVLEAGSFNTEASGTVQLRVTAGGESLEAGLPQEPGPPSLGDESPSPVPGLSPEDESPSDLSSEEGDGHPSEQESGEGPSPAPSDSGQSQEPLPATGSAVAILLVVALGLIIAGTYLRRRARRPRRP